MLKTLAAKEGFELQLFPNPLPGKDQAAVWTQIRRANPDWVISWNLSAMHVVAAKEMKRNGIPHGQADRRQLVQRGRHRQHRRGRGQGHQARHQRGGRHRTIR